MHTLRWVVAGLLLTRLPLVEAAAPLSPAPVAVLPHPFIVASHERTIDFGDGSPVRTVSGSRPSVAHSYAAPGLYTVTVTTVAGLPQILKTSVLVEPADIHRASVPSRAGW